LQSTILFHFYPVVVVVVVVVFETFSEDDVKNIYIYSKTYASGGSEQFGCCIIKRRQIDKRGVRYRCNHVIIFLFCVFGWLVVSDWCKFHVYPVRENTHDEIWISAKKKRKGRILCVTL